MENVSYLDVKFVILNYNLISMNRGEGDFVQHITPPIAFFFYLYQLDVSYYRLITNSQFYFWLFFGWDDSVTHLRYNTPAFTATRYSR